MHKNALLVLCSAILCKFGQKWVIQYSILFPGSRAYDCRLNFSISIQHNFFKMLQLTLELKIPVHLSPRGVSVGQWLWLLSGKKTHFAQAQERAFLDDQRHHKPCWVEIRHWKPEIGHSVLASVTSFWKKRQTLVCLSTSPLKEAGAWLWLPFFFHAGFAEANSLPGRG